MSRKEKQNSGLLKKSKLFEYESRYSIVAIACMIKSESYCK